MKDLAPANRVDYNFRVRSKSDGAGVELSSLKLPRASFD